MSKLVVEFKTERATKNTIRFDETAAHVVDDGGVAHKSMAPMINTQYVQKWALKAVHPGSVDGITGIVVTIETIKE